MLSTAIRPQSSEAGFGSVKAMPVVVCLLCLMPYLSPGGLVPSQVQPWAALLAWASVAIYFLRGKARPDGQVIVLICIAIFMLAYVSPVSTPDIATYLRKTTGIPLSLGIMLYVQRLDLRALKLAVWIAVPAYTFFALLQYVSVSTYLTLVRDLVAVRNVSIGERGAASLAPEATDFGFTAVYLLLIILFLRKFPAARGRYDAVLVTMAIACILMSRSGSGVIAGAIVLAAMNLGLLTRSKSLVPGLMVAVAFVVVFFALPETLVAQTRGFSLLYQTIEAPRSLLDTSAVHRIVHNLVGIIALWESHGLGYGANSFTTIAPQIYVHDSLGERLGLSEFYQQDVYSTLSNQALSVFAQLITEFGLAGLLMVGIVFTRVWRSSMPYRYAIVALMALTWLQSFPAGYPMFWLFLGLARNPWANSDPERARTPVPTAEAAERVGQR